MFAADVVDKSQISFTSFICTSYGFIQWIERIGVQCPFFRRLFSRILNTISVVNVKTMYAFAQIPVQSCKKLSRYPEPSGMGSMDRPFN